MKKTQSIKISNDLWLKADTKNIWFEDKEMNVVAILNHKLKLKKLAKILTEMDG